MFEDRNSVKSFPFILIYKIIDKRASPMLMGVSVSKRNFKKAVDRNRIKRLAKEAYRLQKESISTILYNKDQSCAVMFLYVAREEMKYSEIEKSIRKGLVKLAEKLS